MIDGITGRGKGVSARIVQRGQKKRVRSLAAGTLRGISEEPSKSQ